MNNNMPVINISKNIKDNPLEVWVTIKEFDEDEYYDAVDCFRYCTNPYIN